MIKLHRLEDYEGADVSLYQDLRADQRIDRGIGIMFVAENNIMFFAEKNYNYDDDDSDNCIVCTEIYISTGRDYTVERVLETPEEIHSLLSSSRTPSNLRRAHG